VIISNEQLDEFIAIYAEEFGITPERQGAYKEASDLLRLIKIIYYDVPAGPLMTNEEMVRSGQEIYA